MSESEDYLLYQSFGDGITAGMALSILEDAGVSAHLADMHTAAVGSVYTGVTEVRLMVLASEFSRADELFAEAAEIGVDEDELIRQALVQKGGDWGELEESTYGANYLRCPQCKGYEIGLNYENTRYLLLVSVMLGVGLLLFYLVGHVVFQILALLPAFLLIRWGLSQKNRFPRRCRACEYEAPKLEFRQNPNVEAGSKALIELESSKGVNHE